MIHTYRRIGQPGQFVSFVLAGLEGHDLVSADHLLLEMQAEILSEARGRYSFTPERDDQWDRIKHLLPGSKGWVRPTAGDNRRGAGRPLLHSMTSIIRKWLYSASPKVLHSVREPRLFVEAVLYRYRTSMPCVICRNAFGRGERAHTSQPVVRFGCMGRLFQHLAADADEQVIQLLAAAGKAAVIWLN